MKKFFRYIVLCFMIGVSSFHALSQNITYTFPSDSISFSFKENSIYQNLWRNGVLVSSFPINDSDSVFISFNEIKYIEEEDGIGMISSRGDYAYMELSSDYQYHILTLGVSSEENNKRYIFFDFENNLPVYYIDSSGNVFDIMQIDNEISYIVNIKTGSTYILNHKNNNTYNSKFHSSTESLQNLLFDCIAAAQNIGNTVNDTFDNILNNLTDGKINSTDIDNVKDIFDFLKNIANILNGYNALRSMLNMEFFSNTHVSTGEAEVSSLNAQLHASISNLPTDKCTYSRSFRYEKIVDHNYILFLNVSDFNNKKTYQKTIASNGDYVFPYTCSQYNHGYFYEAFLGLKVTLEIDMDVLYEECKQDWPPRTPIPTGKKYVTRGWAMSGGIRNFKTDVPNICGNWNAVWYTTPPNAKLLTMSLSSNGTCSQTYYYANRGENVTYECSYSYNYPTLTLYKDNGDIQNWEVCDYLENTMTLKASDGFCYYLKK